MSDAQQPNGALPDSLNSSYLSSGFAPASSTKRALPFGPNPALIVIDVCDAYLVPGSPLYAPDRFHSALKSCERLITTCRAAKIPIIFTRIVYSSPEDGGNWYKYKIPQALSCFDATNPLSDYPKESPIVRPQNMELVISKQFSSLFFSTPLASQLKGIDTLIFVGTQQVGALELPLLMLYNTGSSLGWSRTHEVTGTNILMRQICLIFKRNSGKWLARLRYWSF